MYMVVSPDLPRNSKCNWFACVKEWGTILAKENEFFVVQPVIYMVDDAVCTPIWIFTLPFSTLLCVQRRAATIQTCDNSRKSIHLPMRRNLPKPLDSRILVG